MRKLTLSLAVMAALLPGRVLSLGLGEIELKSALNQELNATVEVLSVAPEEVEQVIVKLASREAFARAGIDRSFALQDLKFKTEVKGDRAFIHITTVDPIREPFLSFLIEVDWPNGHLLREYTLLLDPPIYNSGAPVLDEGTDQSFNEPVEELAAEPAADEMATDASEDVAVADATELAEIPSDQAVPSEETVAQAEVTNTEAEVSYQPMPQHVEVSGEYRVKKGDTLWNLANQFRPDDSVSVEQMMLAMVHENPECFIKENIHGVKRGYILRMPTRDTILAVDRATAMAQVKQHTALWREYRQAMSAAVPASAVETEDRETDTTAPAEGEQPGRLNIVGSDHEQPGETAGTGTAADPRNIQKLKRELALAREALESERMQKENLNARLAELEQRVQRVLDMDDTELAKLQADLAGVKKEADQAAAQATEKLAAEAVKEEAVKEPAVFADEQKTQTALEPGSEVITPETAKESATDDASAKPAKPKPKPKPVIQPPISEPSLVDSILGNLTSLPVLGGLLLLVLGGAAAVVVKRRKAKANEQQWAELNSTPLTPDDFESVGPVVVKSQKTEQLDMDATAVMPTVKMPAMEKTVVGMPEEAPSEEVRDDVIAESDVYLAYGIYQQAEDLLRNALSQHPERDDYRMKLLETYFASKNAGAFADLAKEAKARKGNVKSYWDRVVVMGRELCPGNSMFSGAGDAIMPGLGADDLLPHKPATTDLELDAGGIELSPDLDLGMVETNSPDSGLDLDSTMIMQQPVRTAPEVPELDLAADLENIANEMGASTPSASTNTSTEMDLGDFSLDLDSTASSSVSAPSMDAGIDDDFSLDFEASDLGLDSSDDQAATPELDASMDLAMDMEEPALDTGSLEMSLEEPATETVSLDMDMEMPEMDMGATVASVASDSDDFDISSLSEDVDEVSTKLDLARAYMDMGDNEGAKNILEEVKAEGNASQKKQAEELLARAG